GCPPPWRTPSRRCGRNEHRSEAVEQADHAAAAAGQDVRVYDCRADVGVAEQLLHGADVVALTFLRAYPSVAHSRRPIMTKHRRGLPQMKGDLFLSDGGIETTLIFLEGLDLPFFAAFHLFRTREGEDALRKYFRTYAEL